MHCHPYPCHRRLSCQWLVQNLYQGIQLRVPSRPVILGTHSVLEEVASGKTGSVVETWQDPDYSLKRCQIWSGQSQIKVQGMCFVQSPQLWCGSHSEESVEGSQEGKAGLVGRIIQARWKMAEPECWGWEQQWNLSTREIWLGGISQSSVLWNFGDLFGDLGLTLTQSSAKKVKPVPLGVYHAVYQLPLPYW